jgi:hypothetical protein
LVKSVNPLDARFPNVLVPYAVMRDPVIKRRVIKHVAEFQAWWLGVAETRIFPERGFYKELFPKSSLRGRRAGKRIMGDYIPIYLGNKTDGKARVELHGFKRFWKTTHMCEECLATNPYPKAPPHLTYIDFRDEAAWRATIIDHEQYMAGGNVSPLACIPGFRLDTNFRDIFHMDFLGYGRDMGGAFVKFLYQTKKLGDGDLGPKLRRLWGKFSDWSKANGRNEGFHRTRYLVPGRVGHGVEQNWALSTFRWQGG